MISRGFVRIMNCQQVCMIFCIFVAKLQKYQTFVPSKILPPGTCIVEGCLSISSFTFTFTLLLFLRKLTSRQKELITEFAKTENLANGTIDGIDKGQYGEKFLKFGLFRPISCVKQNV